MFILLAKRIIIVSAIAGALYYATDLITACFFIGTAIWVFLEWPSLIILAFASVSFIVGFITIQTGHSITSSYFAISTYYLLCAYSASEVADTLRSKRATKNHKNSNERYTSSEE